MTTVHSTLILCALAVGAIASTTSAVAQTEIATVNVPFAFHIDRQEMPAGVYSIDHVSSTLFLLRGPSRSATVLTHPTAVKKVSAEGNVVFHRIGGSYFLGGLWSPGDDHGMECFQGPAEKQMLQESKKHVPDLTTLALNFTSRR
jgi:hypothetical protein